MALVLRGQSQCALCGMVVTDHDDIVATPALPISEPELACCIDAAIHRTCFTNWPYRAAFVLAVNVFYDMHYRGMRFMFDDGSIEEREPRSGRA